MGITQEVVRQVPVPQIQTQERVVEVPQVQTVERVVEVPQVQTQVVDRQVPKIITQEVVRHQPVVQTQIQERIVEVPQVQVVQPVINERVVETRQQEISYQTSVHQGAPVTRVASHGLVGGVVSTGAVSAAPVAYGGATQVIGGGAVAYGG